MTMAVWQYDSNNLESLNSKSGNVTDNNSFQYVHFKDCKDDHPTI
ncbi:uncharacterized protein METZ01_LOCUS101318 [marine metagenome]|uniref:Uncharacterized protein n=1 Tax=marine metagenome TaxID=408172 RepID=A0A381W7H2_9ZZZZ